MRPIAVHLSIILASALLAQKREVPLPPRADDEGPGLEATMKFIQKHLNDEGKVEARHYSGQLGSLSVNEYTYETSGVSADAAVCKVSYKASGTLVHHQDGTSAFSTSADSIIHDLSLRDISKFEVLSETEYVRRRYVKGNVTLPDNYRVDPEVYVLVASISNGKKVTFRNRIVNVNKSLAESGTSDWPLEFYFHDEEMAKRVAKALVHAGELCGGGQEKEEKEPF